MRRDDYTLLPESRIGLPSIGAEQTKKGKEWTEPPG